MSTGWPLIRELIEEERTEELRQVLVALKWDDFADCRINSSCISSSKGVYRNPAEMLKEVFPELSTMEYI